MKLAPGYCYRYFVTRRLATAGATGSRGKPEEARDGANQDGGIQ